MVYITQKLEAKFYCKNLYMIGKYMYIVTCEIMSYK